MKKRIDDYTLEQRVEILTALTQSLRDAMSTIRELQELRLLFLKGMHALVEVSKKATSIDDPEMQDAAAAVAEFQADFPLLHAQSTVMAWGLLEAATKDFQLLWLSKIPDAVSMPEIQKLRFPLSFNSLPKAEQSVEIWNELRRSEMVTRRTPGIERIEAIFEILGLKDRDLPAAHRRELLELYAVRNLLVHHRGVVDKEFQALCKWMPVATGDVVRISSTKFGAYVDAAHNYMIEVTSRTKAYLGIKG